MPGKLTAVKEYHLNKKFWDLFSNDYTKNCLSWHHYEGNPVIPTSAGTWKRLYVANPDILDLGGKTLVYYRGCGIMPGRKDDTNRIAVAEITAARQGVVKLKDLNNGLPVIDCGEADEFDSSALDPAAAIFRDKVFLYYSAIGPGPDSVGMAVSDDGINFRKHGKICDGRAPDVIVSGDKIYMLYQMLVGEKYRLHLAVSSDGINFENVRDEPVFVGEKGSWDALSIVTARLSYSDGWYYMIYGGSACLTDEPEYFGLARSKNLIGWQRHPGNPIFGTGAKGTPDGGAIWFPALLETEDCFMMLYEGSRGKYSWDLSSAICMSWIDKT